MTAEARSIPGSKDVALMTLFLTGLAGLVVPPSLPKTGLSDLERALSTSVLPLLLVTFLVALSAVFAARDAMNRAARLLTLLSLTGINVAGLLSGRYGTDGAGLGATLVVTLPLVAIIVHRELAGRRSAGGADIER